MKARIFVVKQLPKARIMRVYDEIAQSKSNRNYGQKTRVGASWLVHDGANDLGKGLTKGDAWENARQNIEKNTIELSKALSKQEAMSALRAGKFITHDYFTGDEYMYMVDGELMFEDGVKCSLTEFWMYKTAKEWETGYHIHIENTEKMKKIGK